MNIFCLVPWVQRGLQETGCLLQAHSQVAPWSQQGMQCLSQANCSPGVGSTLAGGGIIKHKQAMDPCSAQRFPQVFLGMSVLTETEAPTPQGAAAQ